MSKRRVYWHYGDEMNFVQRIYYTSELNLIIQLTKSFSLLGINEKNGLQIVWNFYYNSWHDLKKEFNLQKYCELIKNVKIKLQSQNVSKTIIKNSNNVKSIKTHMLFNINALTQQNSIFCSNVLPSYYLGWSFEIHFIKVSRRYNKRYISRIRTVSRPSFWLGNLISCLLVGMFWGASLQRIDWILIQPIIIDINVILICFYIILLHKYINIMLNRRINSERSYQSILVGKKYGILKYYLKKIKWFN